MGKLVGICVALFVLAIGFIVLTHGQDIAALFTAFHSEPWPYRVAWAVILLVPFVLLPSVVLLYDTLSRHRTAIQALELRLDGVRHDTRDLVKSQVDTDTAVHHLARTDPEDSIGALQQRLVEAERLVQVQHGRNGIGDLQTRVAEIRAQQHGLKERLTPVLDKRRAIEQVFAELDSRQNDIERALVEIASGDDAVALDLRLKNLMEFIRDGHDRCDQIERASKTIAGLRQDYSELRARLEPFAAVQDGVASGVKELSEARDLLALDIESLQRTPQGNLVERVQNIANDKRKLDDEIANLSLQFSKLATLRKGLEGLFANFDRALDMLSISTDRERPGDVDARVEEMAAFITATQTTIDEIERQLGVFGQLRIKLGELQSRLGPLEAEDDGVLRVVGAVHELRDNLVARISRLDRAEDVDLAAHVKTLARTKRELEDRVANLTEQFSQLATIRKDIAGLFDKLSNTVTTSSN